MSMSARAPIRWAATSLALASAGVVMLASASLAGPPVPTTSVDGTCVNSGQLGSYSQVVELTIDAAYKGRWVEYEVTISLSDSVAPGKYRFYEKQDSSVSFVVPYTFATGDSLATTANAQVQVLDRGVAVGEPGTWSDDCR